VIIRKGEVRQIGIEVLSQVKQDFVITSADYKITDINGNEVENGSAMVDNKRISTLFSGLNIGAFYCDFIYRIGPEILKARIYVEVVK
jgi:hypothetical protein